MYYAYKYMYVLYTSLCTSTCTRPGSGLAAFNHGQAVQCISAITEGLVHVIPEVLKLDWTGLDMSTYKVSI